MKPDYRDGGPDARLGIFLLKAMPCVIAFLLVVIVRLSLALWVK